MCEYIYYGVESVLQVIDIHLLFYNYLIKIVLYATYGVIGRSDFRIVQIPASGHNWIFQEVDHTERTCLTLGIEIL